MVVFPLFGDADHTPAAGDARGRMHARITYGVSFAFVRITLCVLPMQTLDDLDRRILRVMQDDPDLTVADVASRARISAGACARRIDRMERDGVILARRVEIDRRALGYEVRVFLRITLDKTEPRAFDDFLAAARALPEVEAIQTLLGRVDVRLDVTARDLAHYQEIYRTKILALPHIAEIEALMLVSELKSTDRLPI